MSIIQGNTKVSAGGYNIDQSIRFNPSDTPQLRKAFASAGDRRTWTFSAWVKKCSLISGGSNRILFAAQNSSGIQEDIRFGYNPADKLALYCHNASGSAQDSYYITDAVYRDPSAWMHIVVAKDTTQATDSDRLKLYVNGEQPSLGTADYPSLNYQGFINNNIEHKIGAIGSTSSSNSNTTTDGYIAEVHFIDGYQLEATDFGEFNDDGVWVPKQYTNASGYGTTGFYITGADSADLGADESGNGNDFTSSGLTSDDQRVDTPTNNLMTFNPLNNMRGAANATDGNRVFKNTGSTRNLCGTTFHFNTGKYVQAFSASAITSNTWQIGTMPSAETDVNDAPGANEDLNAGVRITPITTYYVGGTGTTSTGITADANDTYWVAIDLDAGKQWVGIYDNSDSTMKWFDSSAGTTGDPASGSNPTSTVTANDSFNFAVCGRSSVELTLLEESEATAGTIPTGFTYVGAVQDAYAAPAITDGSAYFQTTLYSGNSSTQEINQSENSTFQPDWVWIKERNTSRSHVLYDAVRGTTKYLQSNATDAEGTLSGVTSFDADGFTVGSHASSNNSGSTYAAWQWLAANGTASNTDGSITSTVSANTTAGFSIVGYTGNGTNGATVGHGLSQRPEFLIVKRRSGAAENWRTQDIFNTATDYMNLSGTAASVASAGQWNNTEPTSSVFTLGTDTAVNASGSPYISYCFHSVENFSKVGQYTGNGSTDGPFVWCGFRPAFVLCKATSAAYSWAVRDSKRLGYNDETPTLASDSSSAEYSTATGYEMDLTANGFKIRNLGSSTNSSGVTYIFMAFAEHPFGGTGVAPVPAR